jgi:hypothetical protein
VAITIRDYYLLQKVSKHLLKFDLFNTVRLNFVDIFFGVLDNPITKYLCKLSLRLSLAII